MNNNRKVYYTKGKIYPCERASYYPDEKDPDAHLTCGFITNDEGNKNHCWPYIPERHPVSADRWTTYFEEIKK